MTKEEKLEYRDLHGDESCEYCGSKYPCDCEPEVSETTKHLLSPENVKKMFLDQTKIYCLANGIPVPSICEPCQHLDKIYYSQCCGAEMHDYPDSDICPDRRCHEHTGVTVVCKDCNKEWEE